MPRIQKDLFGETKKGENVERFTLSNEHGVKVQIITLGGAVTSILVPDRKGQLQDVVAGFDNVADYEVNAAYLGVLVGRIVNRIHKGVFTLDGKEHHLVINDGAPWPNHLHGGPTGMSKRVWHAEVKGSVLELRYTSLDGEENYPGELDVIVTYELTADNELVIDYSATTSKPTLCNLTNHSYFNLAGHKSPDVNDHIVTIFSDKFLPKNEDNCPTGEIASVTGTLLDLQKPVLLGERILEVEGQKPGYDHNYCFENRGVKKLTARVEHEASGRVLECYTTEVGVQFYTANYLEVKGKDNTDYKPYSSLCLETQNYPDAINHPSFPSCVLRPGETYHHTTWYKFIVKAN